MNPAQETRQRIRDGSLPGPTAGLAPGFVQTNLVMVPRSAAFDFLLFCTRNPKPCPLIEVVDNGYEAKASASGSDLRKDLPRYRVMLNGSEESAEDVTPWWDDDMVSFLLGCSFSFEAALIRAGLPVRHIELGCNVPMFITSHESIPAGIFSGPTVMTFRPMPAHLVDKTIEITEQYPHAHGGPLHVGDPAEIGISDLTQPDFGDAVPIGDNEVPMFWACGVTPQLAVFNAGLDKVITHDPGHMFITDISDLA